MRFRPWLLLFAVVAISLVGASSGAAGNGLSTNADTITPPPAFTGAQLAAAPDGDWPDFGGNSYAQRYSQVNQINSSNVSGLQVAWHAHLYSGNGGRGISQSAGGLEYKGVYYIVAGNDDVFALDAETGQQIWQYTANLGKFTSDGGGSTSRGLAMGDGMIFLGRIDDLVVALDAKTGHVVWQTQVASYKDADFMSGAVTYSEGKVICGTAGGEIGVRGAVVALDATDGHQLWRTYMVPAPGQPGSETWAPGSDWQHGGAPVWVHPTVDPELNLVYVLTGNASPYNNRDKGDDLYTASAVALDLDNGAIVWHYQTVHHDTWDYDLANTPVLFDEVVNGKLVHGIDVVTKMGLNFLLDRTNGQPLVPTPEVPQPQNSQYAPGNSLTQPIPSGTPFAEQCATKDEWLAAGGDPSLKGPDGSPIIFGCSYTPVVPTAYTAAGWHDDADWPPTAFNQDTGLMYICSTNNRGEAYKAIPEAKAKNVVGQSYTEAVGALTGDWVFGHSGVVTAIDTKTNGIRWQQILPDGNACYSGLMTTAGNVLFVGEASGHLLAYDALTGKTLWTSDQLDASVQAPSITYTAPDGHQYVTVVAGGTSASGKSIHGDSVYSFRLP